ncbi:MAG: DUF4167 domain-containing protein [Sphingomicrobium sp.]
MRRGPTLLINNRQAGRRRGRGGQRPQGMTGRPDGNRQDNRQRGNAAQLLEKYKSLARDSQLAGDRVQTEYYLQYAEHYFRVLGESRARFDEQRRARGEDIDDGYDDEGELLDGEMDGDEESQDRPPQRHEQPRRQYEERGDRQQQPRNDRYERNDRPQREDRPQQQRAERFERSDTSERAEAPQRAERAPRGERPNGRVRRDRNEDEGEQRIAFDVIPPAIGASDAPVVETEEAPAPRRRVRRSRPETDAGIAPAA